MRQIPLLGVRRRDARKTRPVSRHSRGKDKASRQQSFFAQWRTFAADPWRCVYKNSNRRNGAPLSPSSFRDLLDFAGLSSNLAYITSVFISYIGTDSIGSLIKRFAAKKAGSRR